MVLLRRGRVGFLVDAAILGFAVGAGFALVENVEYLRALSERELGLWLVRGLGTAILHGATTAIVAILAKGLGDRHPEQPFLPCFRATWPPSRSTRPTTTTCCRPCCPPRCCSWACRCS